MESEVHWLDSLVLPTKENVRADLACKERLQVQ
jgi:hypothetical protein